MYAKEMDKNSLKLPSALDEKSNKILLFDCLNLLGDDLGSYYDSKMREKQGADWLRVLGQQRNDYNLTLNDPDFVIKEPLKSDSPLRGILPKSPTFYKNLDILRRVRNESAHNVFKGGSEQTREILGILLAVSIDANLENCTNEYAGAIKRIEALENGQVFSDGTSTGYRIEEFEEKSAEMEEQLFEEKERSSKVAGLWEEAISMVVIKEMELAVLTEKEKAKSAAVKKMEFELNHARKEADELRIKLEQNYQRTENLKKSEVNLKNLVTSLALPIADLIKLQSKKLEGQSEDTDSRNKENMALSPSIDEVGSLWELPKGSKKIVLSVAARDLVDCKNSKVLDNVDRVESKIFAEKWLKLRPQGGRIFIDFDGHASTLIDDRLIYLGNVAGLLEQQNPNSQRAPKATALKKKVPIRKKL